MGIFANFLSRFGYVKANLIKDPPGWLSATAEAQRWNVPDMSLYANQGELYQRLSWVFSAVSITSSYAATTALNIKRKRGEKERDIDNHDFELLLRRPNPLMSRFEFLRATYAYTLLCGNSYWWLNRESESAKPAEMWVIPPSRIRPQPDGGQYISGFWYDPGDGREIKIPPWQVVHFREFHPNSQYMGLSRVEPVAVDASADLEQSKWMATLYGENNGRLPGIIAFADPISNTDWATIKADIKDASVKRNFMLLRNAGKGGVEWLQAAANVKDMEMVAGRTFTKEEIYSVFAPGLSSILAVNATEANARTGKATLIEFAIWPLLTAVSEKITNDLLPAYESAQISLVAEFEDIRITDRALELQEMEVFAKTHTIDEVREKYYEDKPLAEVTEGDDERGTMFVAQISGSTRMPGDPEPIPFGQQPGQPGQPGSMPNEQPGERAGEAAQDKPEPERENDEQAEELKRWKRKALKAIERGQPANVLFVSEIILSSTREQIEAGLKDAKTADDVRKAFEIGKTVDPLAGIWLEMKRANDLYERSIAA